MAFLVFVRIPRFLSPTFFPSYSFFIFICVSLTRSFKSLYSLTHSLLSVSIQRPSHFDLNRSLSLVRLSAFPSSSLSSLILSFSPLGLRTHAFSLPVTVFHQFYIFYPNFSVSNVYFLTPYLTPKMLYRMGQPEGFTY